MREEILTLGKKAREAAHEMAKASGAVKRSALERMASELDGNRAAILEANGKEIEKTTEKGLPNAKL